MSRAITGNHKKTSATLQRLRWGLLGLVAAVIAACGGGDGPQAGSCNGDCGTALVTITDAPGDFLSYMVDVTSIKLKKANGDAVETLPGTARIDFAQLVDLSEVVSALRVPVGEYVAATFEVDFDDAEIVVENGSGSAVQVTPVDADGDAAGNIEITVQLDDRHPLQISSAGISQLAFDLDLAASNSVDLGANEVTVSPFVVAIVERVASREARARGRLESVDTAGSGYTIQLRPFRRNSGSSGQLKVHTTTTTRFEINGAVSTGATGLAQLDALGGRPVTIAFGTLDLDGHTFTAQRVLAATSAEDPDRDHISGNVLSRSGNTLTVGGVRLGRKNGDFGYEPGPVTVTVGTSTVVTAEGQVSGTPGIGHISVGQRIEAFGAFSRSGSQGSLDATDGHVRLNYTHLLGRVSATAASALTLNLHSIDGRDAGRFNFAGTGTTQASDADPASYTVDITGLGTGGLASNGYARLSGFATPFGTAAPDFRASTVVNATDTHAGIVVDWGVNGTATPFFASTVTTLTLDTTGAQGFIKVGGQRIDLSTVPNGLLLLANTEGPYVLAVAHRGSRAVDMYSDLQDIADELGPQLNGTTVMYSLVCEGGAYDAATGVLTGSRLLVVLSN